LPSVVDRDGDEVFIDVEVGDDLEEPRGLTATPGPPTERVRAVEHATDSLNVSELIARTPLLDHLGGCFRGHGRCPGRLTAYEFSGNTRANARVLSAATRG
jgi:hypothetical protein